VPCGCPLEAYNRRDLEAVVASWGRDFVYVPDRKWIDAGLVGPRYRGFAGYREYVAAADEVWGGANYLKPLELVDLGTRLVVLAEGTMRAQASGVPLTEAYAVVLTLAGGRVVEVQEYFDHAAALKAVGLDN
jgi:ketosteroid isomerase-like protein